MGLRIVAAALAAPDHVETAADVARRVGRTEAWVAEVAGVHRRRVAACGADIASLAAAAGRAAIGDGPAPDLIICAQASARQFLPDTSTFVQRELGLSGVACFSLNSACVSFLTALIVVDGLLAKGAFARALVCSAEFATRGRNWDDPESASLLGDGAAAVVVEYDQSTAGLQYANLATFPEGIEWTQTTGGGMQRPPTHPESTPADYLFQMDGRAVYKFARKRVVEALERMTAATGVALDDIDLVVPHQPSGPALRFLEKVGFSHAKIVNIVGEYGNCAAASLPMALAVAMQQDRLEAGMQVLFLATGAGVSVGLALMQW